MAFVEIYQKGKLLANEHFTDHFLLLENSAEGMVWTIDDEVSKEGGVIMVWVHSASANPLIHFVRPDWELTIDGNVQEQKFYTDVSDLKQKTVELSYEEYHLRIQFI